MHPIEFVTKLIAEGKTETLSLMLAEFVERLDASKTSEHRLVYNFANMFLISVLGELQRLEYGKSLDDDPILKTWKILAFFGIERDKIEKMLSDGI